MSILIPWRLNYMLRWNENDQHALIIIYSFSNHRHKCRQLSLLSQYPVQKSQVQTRRNCLQAQKNPDSIIIPPKADESTSLHHRQTLLRRPYPLKNFSSSNPSRAKLSSIHCNIQSYQAWASFSFWLFIFASSLTAEQTTLSHFPNPTTSIYTP